MFRHRRVVQNEIVARHMRSFFRTLKRRNRDPETVAERYGSFFWDKKTESLVDEKLLSRSRFYVGLSTGNSSQDFERITKRTVLISDTLLLSHDWTGEYHKLGKYAVQSGGPKAQDFLPFAKSGVPPGVDLAAYHRPTIIDTQVYGMHCPNLVGLGQWILNAEPLLEAGLAWYLPSYSVGTVETLIEGRRHQRDLDPNPANAIDYLIKDGRAVDASGADPIKSQLVRPVLRTELPFIEGVNLRVFSDITIEEFASYSAFRDFLRQAFLEMDESLNSVQSDRELVKLGLQINDRIRSLGSEIEKVRRKRAVAASGAIIGSVGAILVAVYGPALAAAIAAVGASGGVWGIIHAAADNSTHALRQDKWYYVWALAKKNATPFI